MRLERSNAGDNASGGLGVLACMLYTPSDGVYICTGLVASTNILMYTVRLPNFEGPLELLLYFVKRDELDIHDIPIAHITEEFLAYVRLMELLDLELAGEFLVMAATLMQIKARMLLPRPTSGDGTETADDPRTELVRQLIEYSRYSDIADELSTRYEQQRYVFYRRFLATQPPAAETEYRNATLFDLLGALYRTLNRTENEPVFHQLQREQYSVEEQASALVNALRLHSVLHFGQFTRGRSRAFVVATFLALLELCKSGALYLRQDGEDIIVEASQIQQPEPIES
ncbi:MAG: segregation/condensation protein A [Chlorobi bacterium]|nr:segregation/condensation protein A [Chlorobiota bacterium]